MDNRSWDSIQGEFVKTPPNVVDFFAEIEALCKKYNLSISHEDSHGAFILETFSEGNMEWLKEASLKIKQYDTNH